ncbi:hypothetical protein ACC730_37435, partial [Rhizobium ruizarguesonis]
VGENGVARHDVQAGDLGEIGDDVFGYAIREIILIGIAAHIGEGQHGNEAGVAVLRASTSASNSSASIF